MKLAWRKTHLMDCGAIVAAAEDLTRFPFDDDEWVSVTVWDDDNPKPDGLDKTANFTGMEGTYTKFIRFDETPDGVREIVESYSYAGKPSEASIVAPYGPDTPFDHWLTASDYISELIVKANRAFRGKVYYARIIDLTGENPKWHDAESRLVWLSFQSADEAIQYGIDAIDKHRKPKISYDMEDVWATTHEVADALAKAADSGQDCLSTLCDLSNVGEWKTDESGRRYYCAPVSDAERKRLTITGIRPVESYRPGDIAIPTKVARAFGLGEFNICPNAGYTLQSLADQTVYRMTDESGEGELAPTTIDEILREDGAKDTDDVFWKTFEWKHLQMVLDSSGGQSERFRILSKVLSTISYSHIGDAGDSFGDSDLY